MGLNKLEDKVKRNSQIMILKLFNNNEVKNKIWKELKIT